MISSADLFTFTLLAIGGCMLACWPILKHSQARIDWSSEPILWIITLLLTFSIVFKIVQTDVGEGLGA